MTEAERLLVLTKTLQALDAHWTVFHANGRFVFNTADSAFTSYLPVDPLLSFAFHIVARCLFKSHELRINRRDVSIEIANYSEDEIYVLQHRPHPIGLDWATDILEGHTT